MRTLNQPARCATAAIVAALALASTQAVAQETFPAGPASAAPAPAAVPAAPVQPVQTTAVPAQPSPVMTTAPVVQSLPPEYSPAGSPASDAETAAAPVQKKAPVRTTSANDNPRAGETAAAPANPAPEAETIAPVANIDAAVPETEGSATVTPFDTSADVATPVQEESGMSNFDMLGLLAAIGGLAILAIVGLFAAFGRKKPPARAAVRPARSTDRSTLPELQPNARPVPEAAELVPGPVTETRAAPIAAEPVVAAPAYAFGTPRPMAARAQVKGALPSNGASIDLPARAPENYEERDALFRKMVDAKPDKANPFRDRKARMKRARLILQSLGRDFTGVTPWIDLSQYPNNWPELARRSYPQAA